jgi:HPt (histidine-containing phosphotransfer) domain-containing protein
MIAYNLRLMPSFDAVILLREYGDEALVRDLARLLVDTTPQQIDAVQSAVAANDGAALRAAAHKLRGSIVPFGVPAAVEAARRLESMGTIGDFDGADALSRELVASVKSLRESAKAWLDAEAPS